MSEVHIHVPREFDFTQNLQFLKRSPREVLHRVKENSVVKLLLIEGERVLFRVKELEKGLALEFINSVPSARVKNQIKSYVNEWFDLDTDLTPFYKLARNDDLLGNLVKRHYGYRIIGQPDLFESLVWAVLGQQINLQFAYTLKQRFVENFGERLSWANQDYFLFPTPLRVVSLHDNDLLPLQFSRQKSKYVITIAEAFATGRISKERLKGMPLQEAKGILMNIKGVGNWTANYALMKTFRYPDAFPLEDAGLHNAIKNLKGMKKKPSLDQVKRIFKKYRGWEAYATLYLWKSL
jgi:DNA-3-methyladenine glycosylase II